MPFFSDQQSASELRASVNIIWNVISTTSLHSSEKNQTKMEDAVKHQTGCVFQAISLKEFFFKSTFYKRPSPVDFNRWALRVWGVVAQVGACGPTLQSGLPYLQWDSGLRHAIYENEGTQLKIH